jgi:hypothetical protein
MFRSCLAIGVLTTAALLSIGALARSEHLAPDTHALITYPTTTMPPTITHLGFQSSRRVSE